MPDMTRQILEKVDCPECKSPKGYACFEIQLGGFTHYARWAAYRDMTEAPSDSRNGAKGITDVYEKYKHLDCLLSDPNWVPDSPQGQIVFDLWMALKAEALRKTKEG